MITPVPIRLAVECGRGAWTRAENQPPLERVPQPLSGNLLGRTPAGWRRLCPGKSPVGTRVSSLKTFMGLEGEEGFSTLRGGNGGARRIPLAGSEEQQLHTWVGHSPGELTQCLSTRPTPWPWVCGTM